MSFIVLGLGVVALGASVSPGTRGLENCGPRCAPGNYSHQSTPPNAPSYAPTYYQPVPVYSTAPYYYQSGYSMPASNTVNTYRSTMPTSKAVRSNISY